MIFDVFAERDFNAVLIALEVSSSATKIELVELRDILGRPLSTAGVSIYK